MSAIQMNTEQLQQLIEAICVGATTDYYSKFASEPQLVQPKKSFANCTSSFDGNRDTRYVEEFITQIELYKKVEKITDEDALRGISLLFHGLASTWWKGVKRKTKTWPDAIELIRSHYSPTKPAYQIYREIYQSNQDADTTIDAFVCEKRALLAQLPEGRHNEEAEIDLIYGLLHVNYSKHIARQDINTFKDLLEKCRAIEDIVNEFADPCAKCHYSGHTIKNCRKIYSDENDSDIFVIYT